MTENDPLSRRGFLQATGGVAAATALAGCDGDSETPGGQQTTTQQTTSDVERGGTLDMINSTMSTLDPVAIGDTASGIVANQCYEGLMTYPDAHPSPEQSLAAGYESNDDFTEYTFQLKEGVQYQHDMGELTASDVVYSWERLAASDHSARQHFILNSLAIAAQNQNGEPFTSTSEDNYKPGSMVLEATGEYEVSFTLRRAFHATLQMLAYGNFAIHPEGVVGDVQGYQGEVAYEKLANSETYGTGPFQLSEWAKGDSARVEKFDDYRRDGEPYVDAIEWAIIEEPEPQYRYSTNRNADLLIIPTQYYDSDKVSVDREENGKKFGTYGPLESGQASGTEVDYLQVPELVTYYIAFDVSNTPLAVRQALAHVVNRQEIANATFKQRLPPGFHLTPPAIYPGGPDAYDQHVQNEYPYGVRESQIQQAKQVMADAGYSADDPYQLTINSYPGIFTDMVRGVRDKLSAAHIEASVEPTKFATIIEKGQQGTLQCYTLGWGADWPAPDNFLRIIAPKYTDVAELGQSALTYTNWSEVDTEASQRATEAWNTISNNLQPNDEATQARREAYVEMEEANWNDVALVNVVHSADERFSWQDVHVDPVGSMGSSRQTHSTSWIEQS